ncbi:ARF7 effector protein C-terminus [Halocaridina rubra]|uniref:ARF7 effector protein C-terminus n=1 Tax=Halocaridina rubra TaxID=373956 RepID=A0AAN8WQ89_HALRR
MDLAESQLRMPAVLMPSYHKLISSEEGKTAVKRIRLECGVCTATRFYSIHRGITRIAGVVACEACRQFYQRFKKQPWNVTCSKGGKCYELDETPKNKCKACWVAHIICRCPVPVSLYNNLQEYLPMELKVKMAPRPPKAQEIPENKRGGLGLEVLREDSWIDVTDKSEVYDSIMCDDANDTDEGNAQEQEAVESEADQDMEEEAVDDPDDPAPVTPKETTKKVSTSIKSSRKAQKPSNVDPDDKVMATLLNQNKFMENFNPKTSERVKRKKKKVQYFNSNARTKGQNSQFAHGPTGCLVATGKDLCDCLQEDCSGCHFPCPKCSSKKCGSECRVSRKWYYEKVDVEGTNLYWINEWIKKN